MPKIELFNEDCMDVMARYPDKYFDLACVDPPYGLQATGNPSRMNGAGKLANRAINRLDCDFDMSLPTDDYWKELFRVSKNQIVWGGNYFPLPPTRGIVWWDKVQPWPNFSAGELAWTSYDCPAKQFRLDNRTSDKIHPTQKPIRLYEWLLVEFGKGGDRILDTHLGSGSSAIAAHYGGFDFVGCELDTDYYNAAKQRFELATKQLAMF